MTLLDAPSAGMASAAPTIDVAAAEGAVADLLLALGQDPESEHTTDTPRRVAAAFASRTVTTCVRNTLGTDAATRAEFLDFAGRRP